MRKYFLIICSLLLINTLQAQKVWTIEECVEYALTNNIQVKQQLLQVKNQQALVLQDKLNLLPSLNAGATHGYNFGQTPGNELYPIRWISEIKFSKAE